MYVIPVSSRSFVSSLSRKKADKIDMELVNKLRGKKKKRSRRVNENNDQKGAFVDCRVRVLFMCVYVCFMHKKIKIYNFTWLIIEWKKLLPYTIFIERFSISWNIVFYFTLACFFYFQRSRNQSLNELQAKRPCRTCTNSLKQWSQTWGQGST